MSNEKQLKRYDIDSCKIVEHKYGQYVFYPDYQSLQSERDEYRQRLQENVKSIESMLHHNSVQKAEIERLRKALTDITALDVSTNKNSFEDDFAMCVSIASNTLTKKEVSDGE